MEEIILELEDQGVVAWGAKVVGYRRISITFLERVDFRSC